MIKPLVYYSIYAAIVAALWLALYQSGILGALWRIDSFWLTSLCTAVYILAEARLFAGYRDGANRLNALSDGAWFCKLLAILAIASTMAGVLIAFYPFLETRGNIEQMQQHLGQFFSGVTVAVVPAVAGFAYWAVIEINSQILTWIAAGEI